VEKSYNIYTRDDLDDLTGAEVERMLEQLPSWRREKALRFKHEQGRKECACAYLLLCQALKEVYGITEQPAFVIGEHGKPELLFNSQFSIFDSQLFFNISHCKSAIACVVADRPVGIDVERIGRYNESLARHVLNDQEFAAVQQAPDPQLAFTRYWTQKESIVKLTGRGIDDDLKNLLLKYKDVSLHTEEHPDKGYVLTVATYTTKSV
jgi:4'-phosphopantetheinyl transferase